MKNAILFTLMLVPSLLMAQDKKLSTLDVRTSSVCGMCEETIENGLIYEKGVKSVDLDLTTGIIHVEYDARKTDADKLHTAVTKMGYSADDIPADPKAFADLPACCQKEGCGQLKKDH